MNYIRPGIEITTTSNSLYLHFYIFIYGMSSEKTE